MESAYRTVQIANQPELPDDPDAPLGPWSHSDLLLAAVYDAIQNLTNVQIAKAGVRVDAPEPMRRPGFQGRRRKVNPAQAAYLQRLREHRREQKEDGTDG